MPATRTPKLAPYLAVRNAAGLIRFIEQGIGGTLSDEQREPSGRLAHVEMRIADSVVMLAEVPPGRSPFAAMLHLYVPDADAAYARALAAGARPVVPPADAADGDRRGGVVDAWGNEWWFTRPPAGA
jgi:PhnB protein